MNIFKRTKTKPWNEQLERLKERLVLLSPEDGLWELLIDLVDEFTAAELDIAVNHELGDVEAHFRRGRVAMMRDFGRELEALMRQARQEAGKRG